ncbi:MAG: hypothetical protein IKM64_04670 [Clostridia bacterium]|nr:hypothetical protein [Clostridia bacterium]
MKELHVLKIWLAGREKRKKMCTLHKTDIEFKIELANLANAKNNKNKC